MAVDDVVLVVVVVVVVVAFPDGEAVTFPVVAVDVTFPAGDDVAFPDVAAAAWPIFSNQMPACIHAGLPPSVCMLEIRPVSLSLGFGVPVWFPAADDEDV